MLEELMNAFNPGSVPLMDADMPTEDDIRRAEMALHSQIQVAAGRSDTELAESLSKVMGFLSNLRSTIGIVSASLPTQPVEPAEAAPPPASAAGAPEAGSGAPAGAESG